MFIRSARRPFGRRMSRRAVQAHLVGIYALYPLGCFARLWPGEDRAAVIADIAGLLMIAAAFVLFLVLAGSSLQRQAQEPDTQLDERELAQRNRAAFHAHSTFSGIVVLGIIYMSLSQDMINNDKLHLWAPTTGEHWNAIFWGAFILSLTLPAAFLAWSRDAALDDPE